ncbi:iron complex outermembrane receptor protein [Luteibacter sp. OK325]|uniref:TonB-dependent receptor plug domain-containing protein n=1 Tax=Luteibacter sp. OK325 TaxID=2135670 RepID=UPI000D371F5F|nr:TonB-dependent receptor [Luteibacter sp. OK325]PTR32958.1 iron complex outermembrane receptor protein [Luteibacter sp. OK325]
MFALVPRRRTPLFIAVSLALAVSAGPVLAQDAPTADKPESAKASQLDTVIVTGTRSTERTVSSSLQPIDVITPQQLQQSGATQLTAALARLVPSLSFPQPTTISGAEVARPVTLRGLSPDQVLVLIDGKRQHSGAFLNLGGAIGRGSNPVDLNAIPISAIERIEVLRDGQSARYGSDAIGGVINVILKKGGEGGQVTAKFGGYDAGDGLQRQLSADTGFKLGEKGSIHVAIDTQNNDYTNRAGPDQTPAAKGTTYNQKVYRLGDPGVQSNKVSLVGQYEFSKAAEVYFEALYRRDRDETASLYRHRGDSTNVVAIYPEGYLPVSIPIVSDTTLTAGLRGELGDGWHYDVSASHGSNEYDQRSQSINADWYKTYGYTPFFIQGADYKTNQQVGNVDISKEFSPSWLANPVSVSFGVEYLRQAYKVTPGDAVSQYGPNGGITGDLQGNWQRHDVSEYIDLESNITDRFALSLAGRHEQYSDFGGTTSGSLSGRFDFTPRVALRGSVGTGFRAPTLVQQHYADISQQLQDLGQGQVLVQSGTFPVDAQAASLLGAEKLKPEKSRSATLGLVLEPLTGWNVSVDAYWIKITNRINLSSNIPVNTPAVSTYLLANGVDANYQSIRYFTNAVDTRTRGLDFVSQYAFDFANGDRLNTTVGWAYNENEVTRVKPNPAILDELGVAVQRVERRERLGLLGDTNPRTKLDLGFDYLHGRWAGHANVQRYGNYTVYSNSGVALDQNFAHRWTLDLSADYNLDNWTFSAGADNAFNARPEQVKYANSTNGNFKYSLFSPLSWNGRYYYASVTYRWK